MSGWCCGLEARHLLLLLNGKLFSLRFFGGQELKGLSLSFTEGLSGPLLSHGDTTFGSLEEVFGDKRIKRDMKHFHCGNDVTEIHKWKENVKKGSIWDGCKQHIWIRVTIQQLLRTFCTTTLFLCYT